MYVLLMYALLINVEDYTQKSRAVYMNVAMHFDIMFEDEHSHARYNKLKHSFMQGAFVWCILMLQAQWECAYP